ncbi:uncharacterized protein LOC143211901 [Lasioglossum baleicum]|uniref:uncharacterized protein LOC143211901 n=1 Tax=Lasioglossum baleicum TaxID=434251 RepID=UPI003FCE29F5
MHRVRSVKMEEVTKCRYIDCLDGRGKEQILHELPVCDTSLCVRWLINSGHVDLIGKDLDTLRSMKFFVCNNHFTEDCYLSKGTLKENAVPSPHWGDLSRALKSTKSQRKSQPNGQENSMEGTVEASQGSANNCPSEFEANQWCRTCATKKHNLVSMTSKGKGTEMSLLSKLKLLIEIDDEDALPTKMCDECVDKLEQSYKFFQQIYVADNTLRHVFPNARTNNVSRKPLYSLGEHLKKEQKDKEKELEKVKGKEEELADVTPRITRGLFRRGRGRPRTRGYAGRARGRPRWGPRASQVSMTVPVASIVSTPIHESSIAEPTTPKNERENEKTSVSEEGQRSTVFSLLTDTCRSDEELVWEDVLKVMNCQASQWASKPPMVEPLKTEVEIKAEIEAQLQVPVKLELEQPSVPEPIKSQQKSQEKEKEVPIPKAIESPVQSVQVEPETSRLHVSETTPASIPPLECKTVRCELCKETFNSKRELQTHSAAVHSQLSGHVCTDCSACYESESLLAKHRALRHGQRRYRCEHCDAEFLEKRVLREHVIKCQRPERTDCACDLCGVPFASKEALAEHVTSHGKSPAASSKDPLESDQNREVSASASTVTVPPSSDIALTKSNSSDDVPGTQEIVANAEERVQEHTEHAGDSTCPSCNEKLDDTMDPSSHRANCRANKRKDTTCCLLCGKKSFTSPEEYERHLLEHSKRSRMSPS